MDALAAPRDHALEPGTMQPGFSAHQEPPKPLRSTHETSCVVKLKGLPYSTTEEQIVEFFAGFDVKKVSFVLEPDGRPSGLAFAEFGSKDDALKALAKNGEYLGERYIRLLHVPRSEMEEQVRLGTLAVPGAAARMRSRVARAQQRPPRNVTYVPAGPVQVVSAVMPTGRPVVTITHAGPAYAGAPGQLPMEARVWQTSYQAGPTTYHTVGQPQAQQVVQVQAQPVQVQLQQQHQQQPYQQQQGGQLYQASPMQLANQLSGLTISAAGGHSASVLQQQQQPHQHQAQGMGPQQGQQHLPHTITLQPPPPAPVLGGGVSVGVGRPLQPPTSPVVKIRGLPYRSSPNEILAFFQGYSFVPDSLQIGLDQLGRPSGEAWLTFVSPQEALRAVRDLNRHYLGNRYLELSIC